MPFLLEVLEPRRLLSTFVVANTGDSATLGSGSLRAAILAADADNSPGTDDIVFAIPASTAPDLTVPVAGFNISTQDWTISPTSPLPPITRPVSIDGYTQANVPFRYPSQISSAVQSVTVGGLPSGGTFALTTSAPLPVGTTVAIPYNASASTVQSALETIVGANNVSVTDGPVNTAGVTISFEGSYADLAIPNLITTNNLTGGIDPTIVAQTLTVGGVLLTPSVISSVPNTAAALGGNNAQVRVIINGSSVASGAGDIGIEIDTSNSILRGLAIEGFGVGVQVDNPTNVGNLIQGNFIGQFVTYPVDTQTGAALPAPNTVVLSTTGNLNQGVLLVSANATVGGTDPQDSNVILGNGSQGVMLSPGATGNQVLGNQIGVVGPIDGFYFDDGNGAEGVLIESSGTAGDPASIVYSSSNTIGGAASGAGNVISSNGTYGVLIEGVGATRNLVEANYIGAAPGGGYIFGSGNPGNDADGVWIDDAPDNQIGGAVSTDGNVISANGFNGVNITGPDATGNSVLNNIIGLTSSGNSVLGNHKAGVNDTAPGTIIGPGNVISANLIGVLISGATATNVTVIGNLIGTDSTGEADLGNAQAGVDVESATGAIIEGNGQGSQVISGNQIGVLINGTASAQNLVEGNLIGVDLAGTADRGNSDEGVLIEGSSDNTVGGTTSAARNVISANLYGIHIDGATATDNLVEGNNIGTDLSGTLPLGNEIDGIIFTTSASNNSIGGTGGGQGNIIAFNAANGVLVQSGTGDSILSNSIYSNGQQGIVLTGTANNAQSSPALTGAVSGGTGSNVIGTLTSVAGTTFLIQFFSSLVADPSTFEQGQTFLGSTTVTTNASTGVANFNFNLSSGLAVGTYATALATNEATGDTSAFSNAIAAQPVSVAFLTSGFTVASTAGSATITIVRSGNLNVAVSVAYATSNGSAIAGQDYLAASGTLVFPVGVAMESFTVTVLPNTTNSVSFSTVNLTLSQPGGGATLGTIASALLTITYPTGAGQEFVVTNTNDAGAGSLRQAILDADADPGSGVDNILFSIPASTSANLNVPVPGFDPITQSWMINLATPLPVIIHSVSIDGYSQANVSVPFRYPDQVSSAVQSLLVNGFPTGGSFTLTTSAPLPVGVTPPIPYNATAAQVLSALEAIIPAADVSVTTGPVNAVGVLITFQGVYAAEDIPDLIATSSLLGGSSPSVVIQTTTVGGIPLTDPFEISSVTNSSAANDGNNAQIRVVVNGAGVPTGSTDIGFVINASHSNLSGVAIEGFGVGVEVPNPTDVGDVVRGNAIGEYLAYPVDPTTGVALPLPNTVGLIGVGNTQRGVVLGSLNATVGGTDPQDSNVIGGNGMQGVLIEPGASGNQVLGNQIGLAGPSSNGFYFLDGNGAEGILILSSGTAADPASIVYASSNTIGGAGGGAGNLISDNHGAGIHIEGVGATSNLVEGNDIGTAPGGGFVLGDGQPGNSADGVFIDDAPYNQIGGPVASDGNVISANKAYGVGVTGADALGNSVANNIIGLTAAGSAILGNNQAGVADTSPGTVIGPGNVISANLIGVLISGAAASNVSVIGNLIGTDSTGEADLGNAQAGVDIESATGAIIEGNGQGSQVISGNEIGVLINGAASTQNLVDGNFIGVDRAGIAERGNADEGVLIEGASENTVGGTTAAALNVISANLYGIRIDGSTATGNLVEGNNIGTDVSGTLPLGNEIDGIIFSTTASNNTVGGTAGELGNIIAFNAATGVLVQSGTGDSILSNSIYSNKNLGIILTGTANNAQTAPALTGAVAGGAGSNVIGTLTSVAGTTFLIQFFSSLIPDPSGFGQGQTFLGSTTVTTNATTGVADIDFNLPSGLAAGTYVTALATNETTGDTSAFSNAIAAQPVNVEFAVANTTVDSTAGFATILVVRSGNAGATVSVQFDTSNGTATAGTNYLAASGTLTFQPEQLEQSFNVTILPSTSQVAYATTVNLSLFQPTGGATLGAISTAILTINEIPVPPPPPPPPPPPLNLIAPKITSEQLIVTGRSITGITLTFDQAMNPSRAADLENYGFYVFSAGYRSTPGATYTTLSSASFNSSVNTVTLTPSSPLPANKFFEVVVDGQASPLLNNGLTDLSNNQLVGSSGNVGTPLYLTFALGNKLTYIDGGNNNVSLQLTKGGLIEIFISPLGVVQTLDLVSTGAGKSILTGTVRRRPSGTGRAVLPPIGGAAGVRVRLKTPPFYFNAVPSIDAEIQAVPSAMTTPIVLAKSHPAKPRRH
jgi:hypothetical protein